MDRAKRQRVAEMMEHDDGYDSEAASTPSSVINNASEAISVVLTDPKLLDCPICYNPLHGNIYQCDNGHIACSYCSMMVLRKCPTCKGKISFNRCRAMEKMIESVISECKNYIYGCKEKLCYNKKDEHEKKCPSTPCYCPISWCKFVNSSEHLSRHLSIAHASSTTLFTFNTTFSFSVERTQRHVVLREEKEGFIFILKQNILRSGRTFSVDCIGPPMLAGGFIYHLTVKCMDTSLSLESVPEVHAVLENRLPKKKYLTIPVGSLVKNDRASVQLCIKKSS
ncbi:aminotransferase-like mobile domain-containing protein [Tanacetum coccineum]